MDCALEGFNFGPHLVSGRGLGGVKKRHNETFFQLIFDKSFLSFHLLVESGTCCGSLLLPSQLSLEGGTFYLQNISFMKHLFLFERVGGGRSNFHNLVKFL